jgi:chemotaxis protein MotB
MQRVAVAVMVAVMGAMALLATGCVDQAKYDALALQNREQNKLLQEKEAEQAALNERVNALTARASDAQRLLQEKEDFLDSVRKERDEVRRSFNQLMAAYKALSERAPAIGPAGIPAAVSLAIKQLAADYPGVFEYDEATGRLRFVADLTFDSGSNVVRPAARDALAKLGAILVGKDAESLKASIVGHTDNDPVKKPATVALLKEHNLPANNQGLSEARAIAVADILKSAKVEAGRITTKGLGEAQPMADNKSAEGKAKNRRVEVFLSAQ